MSRKKKPQEYLPLFPYLGNQEGAIVAEGEIVVVNFAGIGGACRGLERALRRPVTHAINHNPVAIGLHRVNSPHTTHHIQDVWQIDPEELAGGRRIAAAWFSPDCKHFSKAKGGKPVEKGIRDLGWVTTKYTGLPEEIRPRVVYLENVEEFQDWGPLDEDGYPDKARRGETFRAFVATIESHGYAVEWRLLKACDYGAPTTRKRLFLVARCDGAPIIWPKPTHGRPDSRAVQEGKLLPWRTAAEIIDWSIPCPSIFGRKKPLVSNTLRRTARGLKKYVKEAKQPFIVTCNHAGDGFRGQGLHEPLRTITAARDATGLVDPLLAPFVTNKQFSNESLGVAQPLSTITTNHNKHELVSPFLVPQFGHFPHQEPRTRSVGDPLATITAHAANNGVLAAAVLVQSGHFSNLTGEGSHFRGQPVTAPISTITASGTNNMLTLAHLAKFRGNSVGTSLDEPLHTITAGAPRTGTGSAHGLVSACLVKHYGGGYTGPGVGLDTPLHAITTSDHHALLTANLIKIDQQGFTLDGSYSLDAPITTMTTKASHAIITGNLIKYFRTGAPTPLNAPLSTVTTRDRFGLTLASLVRQFGTSTGSSLNAPLGTVMAGGSGGKTGLLTVDLVPGLDAEQSRTAHLVYELMAEYVPEALTERDHAHRAVFVAVDGTDYVIADVGMRMLTPRELARGQGFDDGYELEKDADGNKVTKSAQVNGIGNSVCPIMAEVLAEANSGLGEAAD